MHTIWKKGVQPFLMIVLLFVCVNFLYNQMAEKETERLYTDLSIGSGKLIIGLSLLILALSIIDLLVQYTIQKLNSIVPKSMQIWMGVISKILKFLTPIILGMVIYYFWKEDRVVSIILAAAILIQKTIEIISDEKKTESIEKSQ